MRPPTTTLPLLAIAAALLTGCSILPRLPQGDPVAPGPPTGGQAVPRTLACEVFVIRVDEADPVCGEELWRYVDEQTFPTALRQRLAANGIRAGIVTDPPPACLAEKLTAAPAADEPAAPLARPPRIHSVLRLLPSQESELVAAAGPQAMVILENDGAGVSGDAYEQASGVFTMSARPVADGRIQLTVTPLVKHGAVERTWAGADGAFRLEAGQRRRVFEALSLAAELADHQALVIAGDGPPASTVGEAFLRDEVAGQPYRRVLVVRPLSRGLDPRFAATAAGVGDAPGTLDGVGRP